MPALRALCAGDPRRVVAELDQPCLKVSKQPAVYGDSEGNWDEGTLRPLCEDRDMRRGSGCGPPLTGRDAICVS